MKRLLGIALVSASAAFSGAASALGNCAGLPTYIAGTAYASGDRVVNLVQASGNTVAYECDIAGWCSSTAAWAYEPGNGMHWDMAWNEVGVCDDGSSGENQTPVANPNGPYSGSEGESIQFSSSGSSDADGSIVSYSWNFGDGGTSNAANPNHSYAAAGTYTVTLTVTDDEGASAIHSTVATITREGDGGLGRRIINGYWHNFDNGSGFIPLKDVSPAFDIVNVSFAEPTSPTSGDMRLVLDANTNETQFKAGVGLLQSRGKKVLISIGGANGQVQLASPAARDKFVTTMIGIIERYNFDGMDIDFEGHSLSLELGDDDFRNPTTPVIVNTIAAIRQICNHFGADFMLTMAPETFFVQLGYTFYGGISAGADRRAGAYLPVIHALRDKLTFLQVQNYNSGPITGLDDQYHTMGNADFHVAMIDMLLKGFPVAGDAEKFFPPLRQDQVLLGLPAYVQAGGGYTSVAEVQRALDCLINGSNCPAYNPGRVYPNLRGLMTWSINWDQFSGYSFSQPHRAYLDQLP